MPSMKTCNIVVAIATLIVGSLIAYVSNGYGIAMSIYGPEPGFWPFILGVGLIIISILIAFDTFRHQDKLDKITVIFLEPANFSSYRVMLLVIAYIVLLGLVGFYIDTLIFMLTAMYVLGVRDKLILGGVTLLFLGLIYVIFCLCLSITLPLPFFME